MKIMLDFVLLNIHPMVRLNLTLTMLMLYPTSFFFVIFFCDGKDEHVEDVVKFDVVVCVVDMLFDCKDDVSIRLFGMFRFDVFRLLHLVLNFFYYNKNNYQIKFFSFYIELVATFNNFR